MEPRNVVRCPRCGELRSDDSNTLSGEGAASTPPGAISLPTFGAALKRARGGGETCACGRRRFDALGNELFDSDGVG